jgi:hypothetical protein
MAWGLRLQAFSSSCSGGWRPRCGAGIPVPGKGFSQLADSCLPYMSSQGRERASERASGIGRGGF